MDEKWYKVTDIAKHLQVHVETVRRWLRSGELKGRDFGGKTGYRVRQSDLDEFLLRGDAASTDQRDDR